MLIIGEKINATDPALKAIIRDKDADRLSEIARRQAAAGADLIDVNVGTGVGSLEDEIASMTWAVETIIESVETPICIDSADPEVLKAGLEARQGRGCLINSVKAEDEHLKAVVPLALRYQAPLIALCMNEQGIPKTDQDRVEAAKKIADFCLNEGLPLDRIYFDPLVLPISTDARQGMITLDTLNAVKKALPASKTVMGLSNISFGLPERNRLNAAFLNMAVFAGLDAVIMDPLLQELMDQVKTAEVLVGKDRHCRRYTKAFRKRR